MKHSRSIARAGMIAALYAALTVLTLQFLGMFAWGPVQFRVSEVVTVMALFTPAAIPGLLVGSVIANLYTFAVSGSPLALLDVAFGSLATWLGAVWMWRMRRRAALALLGPVITNALIVPAYLPLLVAGLGVYRIPFTSIDLEGRWLWMYAFGVVTIAIGQAVVIYVLGWPLAHAMRLFGVAEGTESGATENGV